MATALQCPDCGNRHRLDALGDRTVFACARCSRPLKVPAAYRPGAGANGASGDGTVDEPATAAPAAAGAPAETRRKPRSSGNTSVSTPVRILLWVVAFALGALVVRMLAKWTGFVGGNTLVDLLIEKTFANYFKLFVLVPVWALFSTLFLTLFLEGPAWLRRRRAGAASATSGPPAVEAPGGGATGERRAAGAPIPARVPAAAAARAAGAGAARPRTIQRRGEAVPTTTAAPPPEPVPEDRTQALAVGPPPSHGSDPEDEYEARAASGHRPRRIPRRDTGS